MKPRSRFRLSIGEWTRLVAVIAFIAALPHQKTAMDFRLVIALVAIGPVLIFLMVLIDILAGIPCPGCGHRTLRRLARARTYFCCSYCQGRFKRLLFGVWGDASGPGDDAVYRGKARARRWLGFTIPDDRDDTTTGALLQAHRRRREEGPPPPSPDALVFGWTSRAGSRRGAAQPRQKGETTTGWLLRNQQQRRQRPAPTAAKKQTFPDDFDL